MDLKYLALPLVMACALEEATSTVEAASSCGSVIVCGENAATAGDGLLLDEQRLVVGETNYAGVMLLDAVHLPTGVPVQIDIIGDELFTYEIATGFERRGAAVTGTEIHYLHVPTMEQFDLLVDDYDETTVPFREGAPQELRVYDLKARRLMIDPDPKAYFTVCRDIALSPDASWTGLSHHAVLYRGDKYDPILKKSIAMDPAEPWAFIACNGSAASKLQLHRHTYAGGISDPTYPMTTHEQRTILLRAITADYCGRGLSFTKPGTPLRFATANAPSVFPATVSSIEAVWGITGAICLDTPRRAAFGVTRNKVQATCGRAIPTCTPAGSTTAPPSWTLTGHVLTGNP